MQSYPWILLLLSSAAIVYSAPPPRIFGNKNVLREAAVTPESSLPEEELELENLKKHDAAASTPPAASVVSTAPSENAKRPENEEKPALSDNANSLKFPHHNPGGIDEALFNKKSHQQGQSHDNVITPADFEYPQQQQMEYTPQEIAEYVFWTGDERGVAAAIGDFLQDGLVGKEDAVRFLEDVKRELVSIRSRYASSLAQGQLVQQQQAFLRNPILNSQASLEFKGMPFRSSIKREYISPEIGNSLPLLNDNSLHEMNPLQMGNSGNLMSVEELDYDEIADRLRTVDAKMREYALEDVIYQMGKNLFAESLKNSPAESTQKFSAFVEAQSANGNIPKDLEKDVLEVLVGAFVDAVDEQQQNRRNHGHGNKVHESHSSHDGLLHKGKIGS